MNLRVRVDTIPARKAYNVYVDVIYSSALMLLLYRIIPYIASVESTAAVGLMQVDETIVGTAEPIAPVLNYFSSSSFFLCFVFFPVPFNLFALISLALIVPQIGGQVTWWVLLFPPPLPCHYVR